MDEVGARDRLVAVVRGLATEKRNDLERLKQESRHLARPDFIWHYLLQSFATMQGVSGWRGLIGNGENYRRVTYSVLAVLTPEARHVQINDVCQAAEREGLRYANRKANFIIDCFDRVKGLGGPEAARAQLLAQPGREAKIRFLDAFPGIGPKYARNIMMDVYHEDFRDSIAVDTRIKAISAVLGLSFASYTEHESFYLDVAHQSGLNGWELDRLLFNFRREVESRLAVVDATSRPAQTGSTHDPNAERRLPIAAISTGALTLARDIAVNCLSSHTEVVRQLEQLHDLVLDVCSDSLVKQRGDGALIYVPPQRAHATRNKNLLTMWAEPTGVRMRIMPDPEEKYDPIARATYRQRLARHYSNLLASLD